IGVGFEQYDPMGRYVGGSAPGAVNGLENPEFDGAVELSERLATSPEAQRCFAKQMYRYAHRRAETPDDACSLPQATDAFLESDGDIIELIVALASAEAFIALEGV
ncbi:MAG: DUF1585 domain-containing protein, partial [Myxococcota bacterium]